MIATKKPEPPRSAQLSAALPLVFGAAILVSRIPAILCDYEMNVDESQLIAQVRRYQLDLLPWRSVNGDTGGPLNTWYPLLAHLVGMPLGYAWAHALAAVALAATVALSVRAAGRLYGQDWALVGGLFGTLWVFFNQITDFVQYASELVSILLVAGALALICRTHNRTLIAAFLLGLIPWAKLQAVPIGLAIGLWLVARTLWPPSGSATRRFSSILRAFFIVLAAALPSIVMIDLIVRGGAWEDFRRAYFDTNLSYAGAASFLPFLKRVLDCAFLKSTVAPWCTALLVFGVLAPWRRLLAARLEDWRGPEFLALAVVAASVVSWARTPTEWAHYDFFLLPGLILATGAVLTQAKPWAAGRRWLWVAIGVWVCALGAAGAYAYRLAGPAEKTALKLLDERSKPQGADALLASVRKLAPGFKTLAVWGWRPSVYVRGGLTPPTRQANCGFLFLDSPSRSFLRAQYAADLERSLPDIVLDTGGMSFEKYWHGVHALEAPEVAPVITSHYDLIGTIEAEDGTAYVYGLKKKS